ncbi:MAG: 4-alpha-glucanotransferase [Gammaproteobacteria bacterium]|nr:4-alpha-glucanotransferase [Gammaproteobacteria bacterium]NND55424.1 4-alpha-glucanotransferase [Gammaproteobacteria bacterium]
MDTGISPPKDAGVCLHITSLPGQYGIGELGDNALRFILSLEVMGFSFWQVLPTGPTGFADSPYQTQSAFAGNELLIDIETLLREGWLLESEVEGLAALPTDTVDFGSLIPLKRTALNAAVDRFLESAPGDKLAACQAFADEHDSDWLHNYAVYRVLKAQHDEKPWFEWPEKYASRDPEAIAAVEADNATEIRRVKVLQFMFREQWERIRTYARKHGVRLLGDLPFYPAYDSADIWVEPHLLLLDDAGKPAEVAGVPPDFFSEDGQLWGNPVYDWAYHAADGYAWWARRLRYALALNDEVRIDHFRGFEAYWSIAAGAATAGEGRWVPGPGEALFDALREQLGELPLVAEDLGVITPEVDELRARYGLPGMKVLQFEISDHDFGPHKIGAGNLCYTGTHDNDTTRGWFLGGANDQRDPDEVRRNREAVLAATGGAEDTVHLDVIRLALGMPARTVFIPAQDLLGLGSEARLNVPGTTEGNWRWRMALRDLRPELCEVFRTMTTEAGRNPQVAAAGV